MAALWQSPTRQRLMATTIVCGLVKTPLPISHPWATCIFSTSSSIGERRWCSSSIDNLKVNQTCSSEYMRAVCTTWTQGINISIFLTQYLITNKVSQRYRSRVRRLLGISTPHEYILHLRTTIGWFAATRSINFLWQSRMLKSRRRYGVRIL